MIDDVAKNVEPPLRPEDLAMLERAHHAVCVFKRLEPNSEQASENAKLLINLFQSGIAAEAIPLRAGFSADATEVARRVPRSTDSFEVLGRIERRYRLPQGYFKAKLPHQARSCSGFDLSAIEPAERRRLAWHLPDDFNSLPFAKREEILEWVRRVIISGSTDYRKFQAAAAKQRYAIRFPGVAYGGQVHRSGKIDVTMEDHGAIEDPDLLSGVIDARCL